MRIADCLPSMTKSYLSRTVDAILKEGLPKGDEDRLREQIRQNIDEISDPDRITQILQDTDIGRSTKILVDAILHGLLLSPDSLCNDENLFNQVREWEQGIIDQSADPESFALSDDRALEIYGTVLEVALADDSVSVDEYRLLDRLRSKLGISRFEHRLFVAKKGAFPTKGNVLHTPEDYKDAIKKLQSWGVLFYCNRAEGGPLVVLPEESVAGVKSALEFEMRPDAQALLHDSLSNSQLRESLRNLELPVSGTKADKSARLLKAGCKPSEILNILSNDELTELCRKLPGLRVSGVKSDKVRRIVHYFDSLTLKPVEDTDDPRAQAYHYLEEFAARDNQNLYQLKVIQHDRDMERGFEEGTRYLFEQKLRHVLIPFQGVEHADGCVSFNKDEILLWDNKGKESEYAFPKAHADQFKRYIRESALQVTVFLVIVPELATSARLQAIKLKHDNAKNTDVALITATNLKWVAENWKAFTEKEVFNLEVFNMTGILDRVTLEERMTILC